MSSPKLEKICWNCEHVHYSQSSPSYSEYTPGYDAKLDCCKGYWTIDFDEDALRDVRRKLLMAETCKDYKEIDRG